LKEGLRISLSPLRIVRFLEMVVQRFEEPGQ